MQIIGNKCENIYPNMFFYAKIKIYLSIYITIFKILLFNLPFKWGSILFFLFCHK